MITDLETFAREAPKFQSHYLDELVGRYPETAADYRARSPLHFADRLAAPVILVAGCEDRIVPSGQIASMEKELERAGTRHVWLAFKGEGHGLRRPGNIQEALEAELSFYVDALNVGGHRNLPTGGQQTLLTHGHLVTQGAGGGGHDSPAGAAQPMSSRAS